MPKKEKPLTQALLKQYCDYDSRGYLIWKINRGPTQIGDRLGYNSYGLDGYRRAVFFYKRYKLSRLIFLWHYGYFPIHVDHIDGCVSNDKIENLRAATPSQNQGNTKLIRSSNTSGYRGVSFSKERNKWEAKIQFNNKCIHLGRFITDREAAIAYDAAAKELFKEFAKLNFQKSKNEE